MKQFTLFMLCCFTGSVFTQASPDMAQLVIANFAQTVQHIISMAGRPNDREHLAAHGCGIVQNIANIAQQAVKGIRLETLSDQEVAEIIYKRLIDLNIHELIAPAITHKTVRNALATQCAS